MPIYLVRWPDLSASLVSAPDEDHLLDILDQEANPEGCEWSEYDGPLAINIRLPARWSVKGENSEEPTAPSQLVIEDVGPMADQHLVESMEFSRTEGDEGHDMAEAILQKAFPVLHSVAEKFWESDKADETEFVLPEADLRKALHAELARMLKAQWRKAQVKRGTDPVSKLAQATDLPMALARRYVETALERKSEGPDGTDKPTTRTKNPPRARPGRRTKK